MRTTHCPPPLTPPDALAARLRSAGYAVLDATSVCALAGTSLAALAALRPDWDDLPMDDYLRDGGRYRHRRHQSFTVQADGAVTPVPHRAHWQPEDYNALHGGLSRWFAPVHAATTEAPAWQALLAWLADVAGQLALSHTHAAPPWFGEAHQFRIDATHGIGRPTPEGAHRDGVDLVAVFLVNRQGIRGGETRVFDADGPHGVRFILSEPWSVLLLDDARVIHESTPIQPADEGGGHRDTLVVTLRAGGFPDQVP